MTKNELRQIIKARLRGKFSKLGAEEEVFRESERLCNRLLTLPEMTSAKKVMVYLNMTREFPTLPWLRRLLLSQSGRSLVIPYCTDNELELFRLVSSAESERIAAEPETDLFLSLIHERLDPGAFGILEPKELFRSEISFQVSPEEIDLVIVPGLGFDSQTRRLGRGKGFYDRFFRRLRPGVPLIGIAFDEQIAEIIPTEPHDRRVDTVITPTRIFTSMKTETV